MAHKPGSIFEAYQNMRTRVLLNEANPVSPIMALLEAILGMVSAGQPAEFIVTHILNSPYGVRGGLMAIQLFNQLGWASTNLGALSEIQQLLIQAAGESGTYIDDIVKVTSNVGDDAIRTISGAAGGGAAGGALGIPLLAWLNGLGLVYGYNQLSSAGAEQEADQYFQDAEIITNTTPSNWTVDDMRAVGWHDAAGGGRF